MWPHLLDDRLKRRRIADGQFTEHLAIQLDARVGQCWNESVIMNPALLEGGVQSRNPQAAEMPLFLPAIAISINAGLAGELEGRPIDRPRGPHEPLGVPQNSFTSAGVNRAAFYTSHDVFLSNELEALARLDNR